jgi:hypothetical protein
LAEAVGDAGLEELPAALADEPLLLDELLLDELQPAAASPAHTMPMIAADRARPENQDREEVRPENQDREEVSILRR